jgi:hypothetical protein
VRSEFSNSRVLTSLPSVSWTTNFQWPCTWTPSLPGLLGAEVSFSSVAAFRAGRVAVGVVAAAAAAGFANALCWAKPGWPALSMSRTLHTPANELWNCELRCLILGFISVLSLVEVGG